MIDPQDFECVSIMLSHGSQSDSCQDNDEHSSQSEAEDEESEEDEPADNKWSRKLRGSYETLIEDKAGEKEEGKGSGEEEEEEEDEGVLL